MNKAKLLTKYKELYGGTIFKQNGKVYWKSETSEPILVTSGWLLLKIRESLQDKKTVVETTQVSVVEENFSPLPQVKKPAPKKKKTPEKVEEQKEE